MYNKQIKINYIREYKISLLIEFQEITAKVKFNFNNIINKNNNYNHSNNHRSCL